MNEMRIILCIFLLMPATTFAQDTLRLVKLEHPIVFDGMPTEEAWQDIEPLPLVMFSPTYKGVLTERSEIRIAYNNQYLFLSGKLFDSDPKRMQGNTLVRDGDTGGDFFNMFIDTFNDNETLWYFGTMPSGPRLDGEVANDGENPQLYNPDWNTFWDVKTVQTDSGWFAEMRIPFTSLRFNPKKNEIVFGLIVHRLVGRKFERQIFPAIPPNWSYSPWKASQARKVLIKDIEIRKPVYITPYVLSGFSEDRKFEVPSSTYKNSNQFIREAGLDVKYVLSPNFTLDVTVNTDFAQVEADNFQANITRFSLFFPEKRQFFQERAGVFSFPTSGLSNLFYSRTIGLTKEGNPQSVLGGVRLIGRVKNVDIGFLTMQTDALDIIPAENFGVLRVRKRVLNRNSYIGVLATSRIDGRGVYNFTYGLDGLFRTSKQNFLYLKGGQSYTSTKENDKNYFLYAKWEKRASRGLGYFVEADKTSDGFDPGIGFIYRRNLVLNSAITYGIFPGKNKLVRSLTPGLTNTFYLRNIDSSIETQFTEIRLTTSFKSGASANLAVQRTYDEVVQAFEIRKGTSIAVGNYVFNNFQLTYGTNVGSRFRVTTTMDYGDYYGGSKQTINISPAWNPSKHLEVSAGYIFNRLAFNSGRETIHADLWNISSVIALDTRWSLKSVVQYNMLTQKFGINSRLRLNRKEGNDLYIVYNYLDTVNGLLSESPSALPDEKSWSIRLKYTHTFVLHRK